MPSLTRSDVFIIESLPETDPHDGKILCDALKFSNKTPRYCSVQNSDEFENALLQFQDSNYRYLHISCHGERDRVSFADGGWSDDRDFAGMFHSLSLPVVRVFFSACLLGRKDFSEKIIRANSAIHSIVAPCPKVKFTLSLAFWIAFYTTIFDRDSDRMSIKNILDAVRSNTDHFGFPCYVSCFHPDKHKILHYTVRSKESILRYARRPCSKESFDPREGD